MNDLNKNDKLDLNSIILKPQINYNFSSSKECKEKSNKLSKLTNLNKIKKSNNTLLIQNSNELEKLKSEIKQLLFINYNDNSFSNQIILLKNIITFINDLKILTEIQKKLKIDDYINILNYIYDNYKYKLSDKLKNDLDFLLFEENKNMNYFSNNKYNDKYNNLDKNLNKIDYYIDFNYLGSNNKYNDFNTEINETNEYHNNIYSTKDEYLKYGEISDND